MNPLAEKYIRKKALPLIFCPGCGDGTVLNIFLRAIDEMGIFKDLALVSGIGCSGWLPTYLQADVLHVLHGRAIPFATGLKLTDPRRKVVVFTGDGDCLGIGGNHFIHGARRNIDLTVIMMNNGIYGMTGGQAAPTTPLHSRTQTSPYGNIEFPFDACELARAAGATYVARWTTAHPRQFLQAIKEGMEHAGFSFLEVFSQCPTQAGRYMEGTSDPGELLALYKKRAISVEQARKAPDQDLSGRIIVGRIYHSPEKKEFSKSLYESFPAQATNNRHHP
ncbi:MAG: 2-oxoacid:ferredoxin oxidoreductase subunit beta [Deltaproteobacteria bacterium]|nr:2-oxoacid:ferredoxin oxidoreductase subunit beta [Deltaproteobacteria bacterium]